MSEVAPEVTAEVPAEADPVSTLDPDPETPAEDVAEVVEEAPEEAPKVTVEDAARVLLALVDDGHKIGDRDVDAARDILRDVLAS